MLERGSWDWVRVADDCRHTGGSDDGGVKVWLILQASDTAGVKKMALKSGVPERIPQGACE